MAQEILNSTQINILSSAPSPFANKIVVNQVAVFILTSPKRKKTKVNHEEWHDKLSQSINSFITTQA